MNMTSTLAKKEIGYGELNTMVTCTKRLETKKQACRGYLKPVVGDGW